MLVMSLEEDQAAELLKHMSESSVAKLRAAADSLAAAKVGEQEKRQALLGFFKHKRKGSFFVGDADERFRRVLEQAKGKDTVRRIYNEEAAGRRRRPCRSPRPWSSSCSSPRSRWPRCCRTRAPAAPRCC